MIEIGEVVRAPKDNVAVVRLQKGESCASCCACSFGKHDTIDLPVNCNMRCLVGDIVELDMTHDDMSFALIFLFFIPIVMLCTGFFLGAIWGELVQLILALVFVCVGFLVLYFVDKKVKNMPRYLPTILKITQVAPTGLTIQ